MRKSLVYSVILHIALLSLAFFIVQEKEKKEPPPFFARIITPDELKEEKTLMPPKLPDVPQKKDFRMPKLPKDIPPPKDIFAIPSQRAPEQRTQKVSPDRGSAEKGTIKPMDTQPKDADIGSRDKGVGREGISEKPLSKTPREKLFDKDIIGKLAQKGKEETKPESSITFDTKEFKYYGYLQRLKEKIEGTWKYPPDAAERGIYGDLYIQFTIKKDGRLGAVELVRTSGYKSLDDAAIRALKEADPYWPLPDEWEKDGLTITGRFIYSLYGVYIR